MCSALVSVRAKTNSVRLQDNFDDVVRRRELDDKAFVPSRYFELDNAESSKSLAQIYEDDYKNAAGGNKVEDARDAKLNKDHEEIDLLWGEICYKLDALSNLNFTPKQVSVAKGGGEAYQYSRLIRLTSPTL